MYSAVPPPAQEFRVKIEFDHVGFSYQPPSGKPVRALDDISFGVAQSEFVAIFGPSGCGKSTLLYLLGGFLKLDGREIRVDGKTVSSPGPDRGIVFQHDRSGRLADG